MDTNQQFIQLTGCDQSSVNSWLEMADNDIDLAVKLYFNMNENESVDISNNLTQRRGTKADLLDSSSDSSNDEKTIRKPDSVKKEKMIDDVFNSFETKDIFSNVGNLESEGIFCVPIHLMFEGSFNDAKGQAKNNNKLVLLNIQSKSNISKCNEYNIEFWSNERIIDIISKKYIFVQSYYEEEGNLLASNYNIYYFPSILIINPVTGQMLWSNLGKEELLTNTELESILIENHLVIEDEFVSKIQKKYSFENEDTIIIDEIINNFELKPIKKEIKLNFLVNSKKLLLLSCEEYSLKDLAVQLSFYLKENYTNANQFEVYYDHPKKDLLTKIKKSSSKKDEILLKDLNYSKFRFFLKYD